MQSAPTIVQAEKKQEDIEDLIQGLPKEKCWTKLDIYNYKGTWCPVQMVRAVVFNETHFQAKDSDIILVSTPKSGTTWMLALLYSIVNRKNHSLHQSPLLTSNPHDLVPSLEISSYLYDLENLPDPRIISTHVQYEALPSSVLSSKCKIVYLCRNPLDSFISMWHFSSQNKFSGLQPLPVDEAFEIFLKGTHSYGPFWNHMPSYWKVSSEDPEKILFIKYEDMKKDTLSFVKKLAEFLGFSFSDEEEKNGSIEEIIHLCSLEKLKNMEINKSGETRNGMHAKRSSFFRKGKVGDWANYLSPTMAERFKKLMEEKFHGSGLAFEFTAAPELPSSS